MPTFILFLLLKTRKSGVTDHYAINDKDALQIARNIVKNLNYTVPQKKFTIASKDNLPKYDPEEIYGIVGTNLMRTFDVREVSKLKVP